MKKIAFFLFTSLVLFGCASMSPKVQQRLYAPEQYLDYQPISPVPAKKVWIYDDKTKKDQEVQWESIPNNKKCDYLPIQSARIAVQQMDAQGKMTYLTAAVSGSEGTYKVIMDYTKYRVEDVYDDQGNIMGNGHVGVGLRINAQVVTTKANLDLGSLMALGVNASLGYLSGGISVDVIGIDSKDVTNLIPLTSTIDQSSIQSALQGLASIKSQLWAATTITPHIIAIHPKKENQAAQIEMLLKKRL